ncbi:Adenine phosphoribosyltransferase (modular protein) [Nostocoides japonicum T1-X7]|uniref:Adenine phosphoribosyltransferase n=1 Tax=Nostocoides japonicum T1-X7 TaxID=1194083 RepID=A0A077LXF8_9MICO|nr:Adenine phosphoribosyltransferase (modular protein) [Tetrasphaera japonica T1-X7]
MTRDRMDAVTLADRIAASIHDVPDFPQPGVLFKDITPLLRDPEVFGAVVEEWAGRFRGQVDVVAGIEARGLVFGAPLALALGVGFVPVRKVGKLPGDTHTVTYDLEYGSATIEVHTDAIGPGDRVLVVDDVLATGGTLPARRAGGGARRRLRRRRRARLPPRPRAPRRPGRRRPAERRVGAPRLRTRLTP